MMPDCFTKFSCIPSGIVTQSRRTKIHDALATTIDNILHCDSFGPHAVKVGCNAFCSCVASIQKAMRRRALPRERGILNRAIVYVDLQLKQWLFEHGTSRVRKVRLRNTGFRTGCDRSKSYSVAIFLEFRIFWLRKGKPI